jgi:ATP-dependent Clp protease protease subunit
MVTTARTPAKAKPTTALAAANLLKAQAEAKKADAEAEFALAAAEEKRAAARAHDAEVVRGYADEELTRLMIAHSEIDNAISEIQRAKVEREESFARVSDLFNHVFTLDDVINELSVKVCINTLTAWVRQTPPGERASITLYINSPGGEIIAGFALIDFLLDLRSQGHKITTIALGMAASMGGVLLQAGDVRVMGANSVLLIHEGSMMALGSYAEIEDKVTLMKLFHERILTLYEARAKPINPKTTKAFLVKNWKRRDWWLSGEEALKLGLCDQVR